MRVVVDANVVAAALVKPGGWTAAQFQRSGIRFLAPEFIGDELAEHEEELAGRARCPRADWRARVRRLLSRLEFVAAKDLVARHGHPLVEAMRAADSDDVPYVAAFIAATADFVWTRDQAILKVLGARAGPAIPEAP